jgi:hypothetical protein
MHINQKREYFLAEATGERKAERIFQTCLAMMPLLAIRGN